MVTYHGVTAKVYWQRIAAEGKIIQEYIGTLDGSTNEQVLYTKSFPLTTNAGVATDLETEVDVSILRFPVPWSPVSLLQKLLF